MTNILITGAGGFVGGYLSTELEKDQENKIISSKYSPSTDLTNFAYTSSLVQTARPDIIYNLAAISRVESTVEDTTKIINNNAILTYNLLEAARLHAPRARIITISSGNVYGQVLPGESILKESSPLRPLNAYAVSKLSQEFLTLQYHYAYQLDTVILRPFNHTGPGQSSDFVIPAFARQFAAIIKGEGNPTIKVGNLHTSRDFTDVRDMVKAYRLAAQKCQSGEIYNIGRGVAYTIGDILNLLKDISGVTVNIQTDESKIRSADVPALVADSSKFRSVTKWEPAITFEQTLRDVLQYWKDQS